MTGDTSIMIHTVSASCLHVRWHADLCSAYVISKQFGVISALYLSSIVMYALPTSGHQGMHHCMQCLQLTS